MKYDMNFYNYMMVSLLVVFIRMGCDYRKSCILPDYGYG